MNLTDVAALELIRDDLKLAESVAEVISAKEAREARNLWVTAILGRVTLHGEVTGWGQRDAIERAVQRIEGVQEIKNWMTVHAETIDREVRQAIAEACAAPA